KPETAAIAPATTAATTTSPRASTGRETNSVGTPAIMQLHPGRVDFRLPRYCTAYDRCGNMKDQKQAVRPRLNTRSGPMRKIIVGAQVSMDGVMQAPGGPTEDPTKGFKFGGWAMPYFDQTGGEEIDHLFSERFDLLLGRKTYEIFAGYWPYYDE